jgi:hypothetical protein
MRGMFHAPAEVAERSASQPSRLGGLWRCYCAVSVWGLQT